ncbi:Putative ribonuclease H protein At1g65750 [Linum perenne]
MCWFNAGLGSEDSLRFGIVCWYLWKARNERLFAGSREGASTIASKCIGWEEKVREAVSFEATILESVKVKRQIQVAWQASPAGWVTVNSDGSVLIGQSKAAAGGLLRDEDGRCIEAFACNLGKCSITRAEIRGALEGIRLAWIRGFRKVQVQIDSEAAVAILLDSSQTIDHRHVYREANKAADYLANLGHSLDRGCHSVPLTDCNLAYFIRHDCMGISNPRLVN